MQTYYNAPVCVNTRLKAVNDEGAVVTLAEGTDQTIPADTMVMSVGYRPLLSLAADLVGCGAEIYEIGDGSKVGNVLTCVRDAFEVTRNL